MNGPPRWKDDPADRPEGLDLREESELVGGYDLERIRRGVAARTGGPAGGGGGGFAAAGAAGAVGLAALALLALWSGAGPEDTDVVAQIDALTEEGPSSAAPVAEVSHVAAPAEAPRPEVAPPSRSPAEVEARVAAPEPVAEVPPAPAAEPEVAMAEPPAPAPPAPEAPTATSLAAEVAVIRAARASLDGGDPGAALSAYRTYLATWPEGHLRQEALVAVLECLVALGSWDAAAEVAGRLAGTHELAPRRAELLGAQADALIHLGRCDDALALEAALDREAAAAVRQRCRGSRRGDPG